MSDASRPLSPHLQVYRTGVNMVMSMAHRLTGAALYFGAALLALWLASAAFWPGGFSLLQALFASWLGKLVLIGFTWSLIHHLLGGLRHFIWDLGYGFDLKTVSVLSWGTLVGSILLTAAVWALALWT